MKGRGVSASNLARVYGHSVLTSEMFKVGCAAVAVKHFVKLDAQKLPVNAGGNRTCRLLRSNRSLSAPGACSWGQLPRQVEARPPFSSQEFACSELG